jgi:hypothetical protein
MLTAVKVPDIDESRAPAIATNLTGANRETDDKSTNETERESVEEDESRSTPVGKDVEERHVGDLPGAKISEADLKLDEVYGTTSTKIQDSIWMAASPTMQFGKAIGDVS